jgi:hypothetical protein
MRRFFAKRGNAIWPRKNHASAESADGTDSTVAILEPEVAALEADEVDDAAVLGDLEAAGFIIVDDDPWGYRTRDAGGPTSLTSRERRVSLGKYTKIVLDRQRGRV